MQLMRACVISLCISTVVLAGCESAPPPPNDQNEQPGPVVAPGRTAPATSRAPEDSAVPLESNAVIADPEPIPGVTRVEAGPIEVPEELYQRSFEEVQAVIAVLNQIMDRRDYETWKTHLTNHYVGYFRHPDVLADLSRQPFLAHNNVTLRNLRDYFERVVAPSRARARLDSLVFYSDSLVEAVTDYRGQRVILYLLRKVDDEWKIDTREILPSEA